MNVAEAVGRALAAQGVRHAFGVVGSGNFHVTNALVAAGVRFTAAAHEGGAASMADACARVSGELTVLSVHQGPGFGNALTGLAEAAKSRTPLVALVPEAQSPRSNFAFAAPGLEGMAAAIGAGFARIAAVGVAEQVAEVCRRARAGSGQTMLLVLPLEVQGQEARAASEAGEASEARAADGADDGDDGVRASSDPASLLLLVDALTAARRPIFIAGRGAARNAAAARRVLGELAERCGALLAVSAAARGLFAGDPWSLDVAGGFATPLAATLFAEADLIIAWGASLNMWTTRHGRLIAAGTRVAQVDREAGALGRHHRVELPICGEVVTVARACCAVLMTRSRELAAGGVAAPTAVALPRGAAATFAATDPPGWRTAELSARLAAAGRWRDVPYTDDSRDGRIDPRTLSIALDDVLPAERTVVIDSGNFMGYPSMFLDVPDAAGFCFTQAFQSIGLGLASALGAAVARPDRLTVAALGDGGFLMASAELVTAVRLALPLILVVYNDAAYGAEVHHFGPGGHPLSTVTFPDTDLAAIARGFGCDACTVRSRADLGPLQTWLAGPRTRPLLVDAKITSSRPSWWLEEAFRGH